MTKREAARLRKMYAAAAPSFWYCFVYTAIWLFVMPLLTFPWLVLFTAGLALPLLPLVWLGFLFTTPLFVRKMRRKAEADIVAYRSYLLCKDGRNE